MTNTSSNTSTPLLQAAFNSMLSCFGHQLLDNDLLYRRCGRPDEDNDGGDYGYGDSHSLFRILPTQSK
ncbi:MAG: hypothetical protein Q8M27_02160 [Methylotenera sp.]|nr:hypothetical protein [Methylotenera sp.]